jgi:hypothetical protein
MLDGRCSDGGGHFAAGFLLPGRLTESHPSGIISTRSTKTPAAVPPFGVRCVLRWMKNDY